MEDLISRKAAIDAVKKNTFRLTFAEEQNCEGHVAWSAEAVYSDVMEGALLELPSAQPETHEERTETHACDLISRQAAIDAVEHEENIIAAMDSVNDSELKRIKRAVMRILFALPSAQPERRCVNCGRTVNNGGWYEDGRTRCPIEEHYALPKDGYCHLWEKRKDWEDDYVKRAEEGEK